jgi:hypothetical protein
VTEVRILAVQKILPGLKQKFYVHASGGSHPSLDAVNRLLIQSTGGEVMK